MKATDPLQRLKRPSDLSRMDDSPILKAAEKVLRREIDADRDLTIYWQDNRRALLFVLRQRREGVMQMLTSWEQSVGLLISHFDISPDDIADSMKYNMLGIDRPLPRGWRRFENNARPPVSDSE